MIKVNLVPQEILDKETQRQRAMQVGVVAAFFAVILVVVSLSHYRAKTVLVSQLAEEKDKLKKLQTIVDQVSAFEAKAAVVRSRLGVMNDLIKSRELYPTFMADLIESFPNGVWIKRLGTTTQDGGVLDLSIPASANSTRDVTNWLRTLESSPLFSETKISPIAIAVDGKHTFNMTMKYRAAAQKAP